MKKAVTLTLILISLMASCTITIQPTKANFKTLVVPDDYPTIVSAVGNATEGDTISVRSGIYVEHSLVINKTLLFTGEDANSIIIENIDNPPPWDPNLNPFPAPAPDAIQITASNVKISGFT